MTDNLSIEQEQTEIRRLSEINRQLRADLAEAEKEKALLIGRIGFKSAGATCCSTSAQKR